MKVPALAFTNFKFSRYILNLTEEEFEETYDEIIEEDLEDEELDEEENEEEVILFDETI